MEQIQEEPVSFTYLCMSYPNYLIKRRKLSDACKKSNNQDEALRNKLINFIRTHPDHELRRQMQAYETTTNSNHKEMHNSKINDLLIPAEQIRIKRTSYKEVWKAETEQRREINLAKKEAEIAASVIYQANKIKQVREANLEMVAKQKADGEIIRAARLNKKNQSSN